MKRLKFRYISCESGHEIKYMDCMVKMKVIKLKSANFGAYRSTHMHEGQTQGRKETSF